MYTLNEFENYKKIELSKKTIKIIQILANKVGAPTYIKTPNFKKKQKPKIYWQILRNFKATKLIKNDDNIHNIQSLLNKLINDNFEKMKDKIINLMKKCNENELNQTATYIFEIISDNIFYSNIYAKLYFNLNIHFPIMKNQLNLFLKKYIESFDTIEYIDPNKDYDKFCSYNKKNDKRKSLTTFFSNLSLLNVISSVEIINILDSLFIKIKKDDINKKKENEEISENIKIMITKIYSKVLPNTQKKKFKTKINNYIDNKNIGISNKFKFFFMDIMDIVNTI